MGREVDKKSAEDLFMNVVYLLALFQQGLSALSYSNQFLLKLDENSPEP